MLSDGPGGGGPGRQPQGGALTVQADPRAPLLTVNGLQVEFKGRTRTVRAVRGLSYEIRPGETLAIVGESGSGKSVSAMSLLGLLPARTSAVSGSAIFEGRQLVGMSEKDLSALRGNRIAM